MRILVPLSSALRGGGQLFLLRLIEGLRPEGFAFEVLLFEEGPFLEDLAGAGVPVRRWPRNRQRTPWGLARFGRLLREEGFDCVYSHASRLLALAARRAGVPCIERINMSRTPRAGGWSRFAALDRRMLGWNRVNLAVSAAVAEQLRARGVAPGTIRVIRNFVDADRFRRPELREPVRRGLGIPPEAVVVLNAGRMVPQKAQADALAVVRGLLPDHDRLVLLLAGEGPLRDALAREVGRSLPPDRVRLLPHEPEMARLYAASDILLHTAHWEPLANVLLEAMAAGLPVVATDIDGTREAVSPDCGALFPAGDVEAGRAALAPLLADDDRRRAMGRSAAERVRREFSPARQLPTFAALFREVAGGSAVGAGADPAGEGAAEPGRPGRAPIEDAIR